MGDRGLEIRRSSASLRGELSGMRQLPVVAKYVDTTTCIGCKACEVACQEWNDLGILPTQQFDSYQTMPTLDAQYWNLIKFSEREENGTLMWLMRKDQCMHCEDPGCLAACPAPGAIVQYANGIVDVNPDRCIGCQYCRTGCPFDVPRFSATTGKMAKCTLCVDRVTGGLEPACVKACPTGCLHFGSKDEVFQCLSADRELRPPTRAGDTLNECACPPDKKERQSGAKHRQRKKLCPQPRQSLNLQLAPEPER